jgi:hypothetical protein
MKIKKTKENKIEAYTRWYWEELMDYGYIEKIEREPETLVCADELPHQKFVRMKTKTKIEDFNLFPKIRYTYDTRVYWTPKAENIFYDTIKSEPFFFGRPPFIAHIDEHGRAVTLADTKPPSNAAQKGAKVSSSISFPQKQRMIFDKHGLYIEKFIPIPMSGAGKTVAKFPNTFTPRRYLFTDSDKMNRMRKIKFPILTIEDFVEKRSAYLLEEIRKHKQNENNKR